MHGIDLGYLLTGEAKDFGLERNRSTLADTIHTDTDIYTSYIKTAEKIGKIEYRYQGT